jgi:hypothetical protein
MVEEAMRPFAATAFVCVLAVLAAGCGAARPTDTVGPASTLAPSAPHLDPYRAAIAYARCMRAHGIPHPNPDANGDFHLTPAQEQRMRAAATPKEHESADAACFHFLEETVSTQPLSRGAIQAALVPLRELARCLRGFGFETGKPMVRNLSRGRAMFGFGRAPQPSDASGTKRLQQAQRTCERRVNLSARLDAIIKADRGENR